VAIRFSGVVLGSRIYGGGYFAGEVSNPMLIAVKLR